MTTPQVQASKKWIVIHPSGKVLNGFLEETMFFAKHRVRFSLSRDRFNLKTWEELEGMGYRVVRAELRYPVKGKEKKG